MNPKFLVRLFTTVIIAAGMLFALVPSTGSLAADEPPPLPLTWNIFIEPPPSPTGGLYSELPKTTNGQGDINDLRRALFADTTQSYYLLAGPARLVLSGQINAGDILPLTLETNLSTGYNWQFSEFDQNLLNLEDTSYSHPNLDGSPQKVTFQLKALDSGTTQITLSYRRPFEPDTSFTRKVDILSPSLSSGLDLSDPNPPVLTAEELPTANPSAPAVSSLPAPGLPTAFDWRSSGKVTSIKNQNPCGNCWSFGAIGTMESALLKYGRGSKDLSEQYLFDCDNAGYNCNSGGLAYVAADYLKVGGTYKAPQTTSGAVMESAKPYLGADGTCPTAYAHPYKITGWGFVNGSNWNIPTETEMKNAIYTYGPVSVSMCAGSVFQAYTGGIYTTDESSDCSGGTNHAVMLVGWNDSENTWILRNSWGTTWGESGYMRTRRTISSIGRRAMYYTNVTGEYPGFNSQFNGNASGWSVIYGTWGINSTYYYSTGSPVNHWSSARYGIPYTNLDYQARMYRPGTTNAYSNTLIVRGTPTPFQTSYHRWNKGYFFNYTNTGYYSVWRWMSNGETALKNWTYSSYIVKGGWNTLRVRAVGSSLLFYINGHLVWNGTNTSISSGYVGLAKYNYPSPSYTYNDWAIVTNLSAPSAPMLTYEQISPEQLRYNNAATSNPPGTDSTRGPAK